jgi:hypothetical protein
MRDHFPQVTHPCDGLILDDLLCFSSHMPRLVDGCR